MVAILLDICSSSCVVWHMVELAYEACVFLYLDNLLLGNRRIFKLVIASNLCIGNTQTFSLKGHE